MQDILVSLLRGLLASALGYGIWWLVCAIRQRQKRGQPLQLRAKASPMLAKKLLTLVNGDTETARRLLRNVKRSHPGRSVDWCLEKAIYDLDRDRR